MASMPLNESAHILLTMGQWVIRLHRSKMMGDEIEFNCRAFLTKAENKVDLSFKEFSAQQCHVCCGIDLVRAELRVSSFAFPRSLGACTEKLLHCILDIFPSSKLIIPLVFFLSGARVMIIILAA